jgi:DTW domain-containing protein YfiP
MAAAMTTPSRTDPDRSNEAAPAPGGSRVRCPRCERPVGRGSCICRWAGAAIANEVELLILQHPLERFEAKGTARLLQLSLQRSRLLRGERFEPPPPDGRTDLLLYPETPASAAPRLDPPWPPPQRLRLIVLDGSWRKSRLLLHANPWLQQLPRLALHDDEQLPVDSPYAALRKAQRRGQLSTLEASVLALQQLEQPMDERYAPLWRGFAGFVEQQLRARPR